VLGVELPLFEDATGPFIGVRALVRWSEDALGGRADRGPGDRQAVLALTVAWHQIVSTHLVDLGDEAPR
jgi:hypothetical protein